MRKVIAVVLLGVSGCSSPAVRVLDHRGEIDYQSWSESEVKQDFAYRGLEGLTTARSVLMNLNSDETPHVHREHDLFLTVLKGLIAVNFDDKRVEARPGDTVIVRKGILHWIERATDKPTVVNIIAAPAEWNDDQHEIER